MDEVLAVLNRLAAAVGGLRVEIGIADRLESELGWAQVEAACEDEEYARAELGPSLDRIEALENVQELWDEHEW